ncbi:MAG: type II toxin-antitoxin system mRNA interferase toxin, RelE/StbE family [Candidatus Sungbacteria bacterium]|uniref:Type II toxin-antitoxin system mRNA interferase toxin, RelE/StbE family n=1 Tax=Candidatus Sungiibacteriota bacterium TaxID=2750080 RepID=A0A932DS84_9BACT|nr:type II toxin-antitoxin system mRNA interferase toxin, RelE/StbE family [Candidatus Sungbacteria bacterium]MBI2465642.1 type II toxin-antitoxin system mRNA interferase toxin, RelE/StbE family [Candidatus Sungbacteria bacterium]
MVIRTTSRFRQAYKKLPQFVKEKASEREVIFRNSPFDSRLDTHKLHGKYKNYLAFTVVGQYRIMFAFNGENVIDFVNIGTHEIYK